MRFPSPAALAWGLYLLLVYMETSRHDRAKRARIEQILSNDPSIENIELIAKLEREALHRRTRAERVSDAILHSVGTVTMFAAHVILCTGWVIYNSGWIPGVKPVDPYPFSFLTMVSSLEAILVTLLVLITQNRMTRQAEQRAHLNLQLDLLEEQEMTRVLRMLNRISEHLNVDQAVRTEEVEATRRLMEQTDVKRMYDELQNKIPS